MRILTWKNKPSNCIVAFNVDRNLTCVGKNRRLALEGMAKMVKQQDDGLLSGSLKPPKKIIERYEKAYPIEYKNKKDWKVREG